MNKVILVDNKNQPLGEMEKIEAHKKGLLHRSFSIFVFNDRGELLLQKRNSFKYHSGGLWSNTVCSHPSPGESYEDAIHRRLREEMGFDCKMIKLSCFIYKSKFDNGLTEYEYDCLFLGSYDNKISPNPREVEDHKWLSLDKIKDNIKSSPDKYSFSFKKIINNKQTCRQLEQYIEVAIK